MAASAGGLEAVSELLAALPVQCGVACIVVQHLDPGHESLLTEILAKRTSLSVVQAYDGVVAAPDHVYVIPPNTTLSMTADRICVIPRASGLHHPADILFTSLAEERGDSAIGVVLSGGDGDGALGIQAIKQAGGITFAQEPASARFASMPRNAIATGCVDFVLRPKEIARELARLSRHPYLRSIPGPDADTDTTMGARAGEDEAQLRHVFRRLRTAHGVDFSHYKRSTLRRRLARQADSAQKEADRWLLAHFAPASLLIDEGHNILQFRGETSPYLEHASGPPSVNLQRVVRPELLVELSAAIQEARETGSRTRREGLRVGDRYQIAIDVVPLKRQSTERCYLILFEDGSRQPSAGRAQPVLTSALPESEKDRRLAQSDREIASVRDYLQATLEEHEAVKEELKSAHEEVLSANEEFQSTNEELETAKEELQSANEELTTTNDELRNRNRELGQLNINLERARAYADVIVESMREPLLVLDGDLKIVRANRVFYADFKTRREDTEGRLLYELGMGEWNTPRLREKLHAVLTRSEPVNDLEVELTLPLADRRLMSLSARKIPAADERGELILLALDDVTERAANADTLRETSRRKDEFLAMLAHELRNPLTPIRHAIHLLRHPQPDQSPTHLYDMIDRQTVRLVRLVDELLDVARISRGLIELKRETLDLGVLVRHAADACRARIEERGHTLSLEVPGTGLLVDGDSVRVEQVISNLLENAAKYTLPGGRITLTLARVNGEAVLSVRDTGIGLEPAVLERIFDLFTQVDNSLVRSGGGLGLGLAVVRRVLELHGGYIEAHSAGLGQGSEFIVRLPALSAATNLPQAAVDAQPKATFPASRARRVLIIDDNADSAEALALLARSWGHEVAVARDGPGALALAERFAPESVLVDIGLPGMDGYELARRFREQPRYRDLVLVALTGYGREEDRSAARAAGFDGHLVKPAEIKALEGLLANGRGRSGS
jgi:two-component system CheB/CheR fusion protein